MPLQARRGGGQAAAQEDAERFLRDRIKNELFGDHNVDEESRQMWRSMDKWGLNMPAVPVGIDGNPFYGTISEQVGPKGNKRPATFADLSASAAATRHYGTPAEHEASLSALHGVDALTPELREQELRNAQARQKFVGAIRGVSTNAVLKGTRNLDEGVAEGIPEAMDLLGQLMPSVHARITAKDGKAVADGFEVKLRNMVQGGNVKGALEELGIAAEQLKGVVPPEVNTVEGFSAPLLKNLPAWGQAVAIGGVGGASTALAMHLMAQGQQQSSSADYAAAMQALNAY